MRAAAPQSRVDIRSWRTGRRPGSYPEREIVTLSTPSPSSDPSVNAPEQLSLALQAVVGRFESLVRKVGWRHGLDGDDLDEVMQDVRLRLWRARGGSEQILDSSASYVYRTATSAALDLIRRRRRTTPPPGPAYEDPASKEDVIGQLPSTLPGGGSPEHMLEATDVERAVQVAISRIAMSRRPVVRMYLLGHPQMEIATLMGWSEAKTRNLLYRGLADLRVQLTAMGYGPEGATP